MKGPWIGATKEAVNPVLFPWSHGSHTHFTQFKVHVTITFVHTVWSLRFLLSSIVTQERDDISQVTKDKTWNSSFCQVNLLWCQYADAFIYTTTLQGGNEVCFFIVDPIFVRKFLILDSKSVTNYRPWSHKHGTAWSLIPKKLVIPIPWSVIPDPMAVIPDPTLLIPDPIPLIPDPTYLVTTLTLTSLC